MPVAKGNTPWNAGTSKGWTDKRGYLRRMNMWQPIETAPRDQTFLVVLDCAGEQTVCTMRWPVVEAKNNRPDGNGFHVERVTHWMPLPDLPGAQPVQSEDSITAEALSGMFLSLEGYDKAQPGYEWRKGWNDAIRQAMDYAQPAPSIPEGWKLVPIEPTQEMLDAGDDTFIPTYTGTPVSAPIDVYRAMLAAAPEAKP